MLCSLPIVFFSSFTSFPSFLFFHFFFFFFFFFNDTATTEIYTLSLHDALPIYPRAECRGEPRPYGHGGARCGEEIGRAHRLNSSHTVISYAVFCLKKKKKKKKKEKRQKKEKKK